MAGLAHPETPKYMLRLRADSVREVFRQFDADGKGLICREEMLDVLLQICPDISPEAFSQALEESDLCDDSNIDIQKLTEWLFSDEFVPRPAWLATEGPGNMNVEPQKWALTIRQWTAFMSACTLHKGLWSALEASSDGKAAGHVNLYQICDCFVRPWTRNTGNSIALLMNSAEPLQTELMLSHAWGEDILQVRVALLGKTMSLGIGLSVPVWFCLTAQYQAGDLEGDCGPGMQEQLDLDPFLCVLNSELQYGMLVLHTTESELYTRLWCVYEMSLAQSLGVETKAACSMRHMASLHQVTESEECLRVDTAAARCYSADDEALIRAKIEEGGGYEELNDVIWQFRCREASAVLEVFRAFEHWSTEFDVVSTDPVGFLIRAVSYAADIIGLHCLYVVVTASHDQAAAETILASAKDDFITFQSEGLTWPASKSGAPLPPPFFDPLKLGAEVDTDDDEAVSEALKDIHSFPQFEGLLEMCMGGSIHGKIAAHLGIGRNLAMTQNLENAFGAMDLDDDGKVSSGEFANMLKLVRSSIKPEEVSRLYTDADVGGNRAMTYKDFRLFMLGRASSSSLNALEESVEEQIDPNA